MVGNHPAVASMTGSRSPRDDGPSRTPNKPDDADPPSECGSRAEMILRFCNQIDVYRPTAVRRPLRMRLGPIIGSGGHVIYSTDFSDFNRSLRTLMTIPAF